MQFYFDTDEAIQALENAAAALAESQVDYNADYQWIESEAKIALAILRSGSNEFCDPYGTIEQIESEIANQKRIAEMEEAA